MQRYILFLLALSWGSFASFPEWSSCAKAADEVIPHAQDKPPGPALSPREAIAKMTVPEGFHVELVASEPDIVNPVAMTFDERGRVWITESLEYPRMDAGPGRDRIKVLEDTDGDGAADKFTIFAEGFNIPSGIAVGYGGVWLANAPDILFLQDTDGDGRADKQEVVVTGFGRDDTHELPNSLTWGPDGWLYGLNGVFNASTVEQGDKKFDFTCALFRIHPRTREFQLFAQGTSNPWGVAWDPQGNAFLSACVIDHLWHLTESGYYIRQGGPYPPFTDPLRSIVDHKHQKAAYCGIHYFDSDAYPAEYRDRLYMGNIHGNCLNVDVLERRGATYFATPAPDFLSANDAWFMPVVQKTGPDGCLYVLDWYDRYHCYQDARRDPEGIDRLKGRLYRIRYQDSPRAEKFDLAAETDSQLIKRLHSPNVYFRDIAQRILAHRNDPETRPSLEALVTNETAPHKTRMHALWALIGGGPLSLEFHRALLAHEDPALRAWGVRAAGNMGSVDGTLMQTIASLADDPAADVRLQVAVAARKLQRLEPLPLLLAVLDASGDDPLIRHIVWQNLHPLLEDQSEKFFELAADSQAAQSASNEWLLEKSIDRALASSNPKSVLALVDYVARRPETHRAALSRALNSLATRLQNREVTAEQLAALRPRLEVVVADVLASNQQDKGLHDASALLAATWNDPRAVEIVRAMFVSPSSRTERRAQALHALVAARDETLRSNVTPLFDDVAAHPVELRRAAIEALGRLDQPWVAELLLNSYPSLEAELRPKAVELLCERTQWAEQLIEAIGAQKLPSSVLNANQVRQLLVRADEPLAEKLKAQWGSVRDSRNPQREEVIDQMRTFLRNTSGDAIAGQAVFKRVCGQCHKLHGQGEDVGPDITLNGRNSFEQLLSNVFDPSLVIGASYQAQTVVTADGRVLTGLVAEDSPQRVVLKTQGGKHEVIARGDVELMKTSALSLMPEDLEKQLKPQELADLFALLTLDKPPTDPTARKLPGSQPIEPRETIDPKLVNKLIRYVAPGFHLSKGSNRRVAIVAEHAGRQGVLRISANMVLASTLDVSKNQRMRLVMSVSPESKGSGAIMVKVNGVKTFERQIADTDGNDTWQTVSCDLTKPSRQGNPPADNKALVEIFYQPRTGPSQGVFWGQLEVISE
jgi:putative membrane-bound dehydrogenase-like protein